MSIRRQSKKGTGHETSYSITPVIRKEFTDWNGGLAIADKPENRRDGVLLDRPTMEMGNETMIGDGQIKEAPPLVSYVIDNMNLYERFRSHNRDTWWKHRTDSSIPKDVDGDSRKQIILSYSYELGLNQLQSRRAFRRLIKLNLRKGTGRRELNAFIICSLVANEDAERYGSEKLYHPQRSQEKNDGEFQRLEDALKERFSRVTKSSLTKVYNILTQGDPPTKDENQVEVLVRRESKGQYHPSYSSPNYDPREGDE